jgi:valyl-tRNA synthetase
MVGELKIVIPLPDDMRERERARLTKEKEKLAQQEQATRARLANPDFAAKAPLELVDKLRAQLEQIERDLMEIAKKLKRF